MISLGTSLVSTTGRGDVAAGQLGTPAAAGFLGLEAGVLDARLGPPAFKRIDPPAEFRRYRLGPCALELILYPHPEKPSRIVAHARYRGLANGPPSPRPCGAREP